MSKTGAIPKGSVRPKIVSPSQENVNQDETEKVARPLDQREISISDGGIHRRILALHREWMEPKVYIHFTSPPLPDEDGLMLVGEQETWVEHMEFLKQDLSDLLTLPHHRFWSQVVYDPLIHQCLESYLSNGPRWYDDNPFDEVTSSVLQAIHQLVFLIFVRMSTYKESKMDHITPSVFGNLLYDHFLFDICKILDLCALYGSSNGKLLSKMISNIFTCQPKYYEDLKELIMSLDRALENVEVKLGVTEDHFPVALSSPPSPPSLEEINDFMVYLLDVFYSLHCLLTLCPELANSFHAQSFELRISSGYERVYPKLAEELNTYAQSPECKIWADGLLERLGILRALTLASFHDIFHHVCMKPLEDNTVQGDSVDTCMETFLQVMSNCVGEKTFLTDYATSHSIEKHLELFKSRGADTTGLVFIEEAVSTTLSEAGISMELNGLSLENTETAVSDKADAKDSGSDPSGMTGYLERETAQLSSFDMACLVSRVLDLLPDLGAGFIQECLKYYNHSVEDTINAVLEDNLPSSLSSLDRTMAPQEGLENLDAQNGMEDIPESQMNGDVAEKTDDTQRANVYDNDEFDVFSRSHIDRSKVHKGKKGGDSQQDVDYLNRVKEIAHRYDERLGCSIYEDEEFYAPSAINQYEDEYDDTYDDNEAGNIDEMGTEQKARPTMRGRGAMNIHGILQNEVSDQNGDQEEAYQRRKGVRKGIPGKALLVQEGRIHEENKQLNSLVNGSHNSRSSRELAGRKRVSHKIGNTSEQKEQGEEAVVEEESSEQPQNKLSFEPFCENPEDVRQRAEQRRLHKEIRRNRGARIQPDLPPNRTECEDDQKEDSLPKYSGKHNRNSGKAWRQGSCGDDDEGRRPRGGKYKEDTNHGKVQDSKYRQKMIHKNEFKRYGAQAKFNRNN